MKRSSWIIIGIIAALILVLAYQKLSAPIHTTDEAQIHALLADEVRAIEHKDVRGALRHISNHYADTSGNTFDTLRILTIKGFREPGSYGVTMESADVTVQENTALVKSRITIYTSSEEGRHDVVFSQQMDIILSKEQDRRWLIFPTKAWKITGISGLPSSLD